MNMGIHSPVRRYEGVMHTGPWKQREEANASHLRSFSCIRRQMAFLWCIANVVLGIHSRNVPSGAYGLLSGIALAPAHWFPVTSTHQIKSKYPSIAKSMHCVGCEPLPQLTANKHLPAVKLLRSLWEAHRSRMARSKQLEALEIECKFGTDDFGWWLITLAKHKHCIL